MAAIVESLPNHRFKDLRELVDPVTLGLGKFSDNHKIMHMHDGNFFLIHVGLSLSSEDQRIVVAEKQGSEGEQNWYPGIVHQDTLENPDYLYQAIDQALMKKPVDPSRLGEIIREVSSW